MFTVLELRSKDLRDEKGDSCFQHKVVIWTEGICSSWASKTLAYNNPLFGLVGISSFRAPPSLPFLLAISSMFHTGVNTMFAQYIVTEAIKVIPSWVDVGNHLLVLIWFFALTILKYVPLK